MRIPVEVGFSGLLTLKTLMVLWGMRLTVSMVEVSGSKLLDTPVKDALGFIALFQNYLAEPFCDYSIDMILLDSIGLTATRRRNLIPDDR